MPPFGFDKGSVSVVPVLGSIDQTDDPNSNQNAPFKVIQNLRRFVQSFRIGESFIYRDRLRINLLAKVYALEIEMQHLIAYDEELAHSITNAPAEILPLFELAVRKVAESMLSPMTKPMMENALDDHPDPELELAAQSIDDIPDLQVTLRSEARLMHFRDLLAPNISKLVRMPGIVISASTLSSRATMLHLMCKSCKHIKRIAVQGGFTGFTLPRICSSTPIQGQTKDCPMDPYMIVHEKSRFVDQQSVKLQEAPDMVPVGELPRHILLSLDRYLTGKVVPGSRIIATGIYSTFNGSGKNQGAIALRQPYLRVVGLELDRDGNSSSGRGRQQFTAEEELEFNSMARHPEFYSRFSESIAPSIYGTQDIKKAIVCLLMGGSKKILPDGMRLRGDINVLLLGDPGTAKSQLLKFVEKVSPISVYTSGKGSSAAGLTASVQRDPQSREFYLEGGAMVLADGGVVCIDEFDKMRDEDRVAIHEAMEQQTISIAKAGITTILNSRTSVLAAANPVFGRYDDMKTPGENIDFQTTILSRFDMIFIVKDEHDEQRDRTIARHVMALHINRAVEAQAEGEIDLEKMKRFISFAKSRCAPRVSTEAAEQLSSHFVSLRKQVQQVERDSNERSSIPITIRQLEAIIRISESLAKLRLSPTVENRDVEESIRLFKFSTIESIRLGSDLIDGGRGGNDIREEIEKVEKEIRKRLPIGWTTSYNNLVKEFVNSQGFSSHGLERCLYILEKKEVIRFTGQKRTIQRIGA
ncbi:minichromosome maintenance protein 5 [Phakopsora pachyrhizi]|uniref:DNA replication licensing factor MCM5 n=1 Tax=Phakopsora pachyrhizi TaxID=170000 RepID=A0AAV0AP55_PHAPC|nr:minichromosome maintenance protein 5 [Phakopsora pachyrhizi]CAH7669033.1 minichromosome maintenance protein 5 [Phakopsora pachyrhizi]